MGRKTRNVRQAALGPGPNLAAKALTRSIDAAPADVAVFAYDHHDIALCEAFLLGSKTLKDISIETELDPEVIRHRLLDPVRCGWISLQLEKAIQSRLGRVLASVYSRAVSTGDVGAAQFLYKLFGRVRPEEKRNLNVNVSVDLQSMTKAELEAFVADEGRKIGLTKQEGTEYVPGRSESEVAERAGTVYFEEDSGGSGERDTGADSQSAD